MRLLRTSKRPATFVAVASAAIILAACGSSDDATDTTAASTTSGGGGGSAAGKKIAFVGDVQVPVVNAVQCGMAKVAKKAGVEFEYQAPDAFDPAKQIAILNAVVASKPDVIIISPDDPNALVTPLKQAEAEGIKIVLNAHDLSDNSFASAVIKNDDYAGGVLAAKLLAEKIGDKKGKVALLAFTAGGSTITDARQKGFEDEIKKYSNLDYIGPTVLNSIKLEDGSAAANALMSSHPDLVGMAANSEDYSIGMAQAIKQRGKSEDIVAVQMDATDKATKLVPDGTMDAMSSPIWYQLGEAAMEQAVKVAAGETVDKDVPALKPISVTAESIDSADAKLAAYAPKGPC